MKSPPLPRLAKFSRRSLSPLRGSGSLDHVTIEQAFTIAWQHQQAGRLAEAESSYRQILARNANQPEVLYNLGLVLRQRGHLQAAVSAYEAALALKPHFPSALHNLGETLGRLGQLDEAEDIFRHALLLEPDSADAWNNLGGTLKDLGRIEESIDCLRRAVQLAPANPRIHSNLVFALHYSPTQDAATLRQAAQQWNQQYTEPLRPDHPTSPDHDRSPNRRLRIGYVSPNFRDHCQALFTRPLFTHHDHERFEIFCYSDVATPDATTAKIQSSADHWRQTDQLDDVQLAAQIRQDKIDVLVDLTLHMTGNRLLTLARKPAPVQVTWLGYPGTTGMKTIDYRITDPNLDPRGANDDNYSERSFRLPESFWCYDPLTDQPAVNSLPAGRTGQITLGCLNNFCKINDDVLNLWSQILSAVPESKLVMIAPVGAARARVKAKLKLAAKRVEFIAHQPREDYLKEYQRLDLCLDTFPYNGHTTSLDSLWMGVPVVSLRGRTVVSRAGLSLMANLGLPELVANEPAEFVRLAVALAQDRPRLAALRSSLRPRMAQSPLMNAERFARNIEQAYRTMWQAWCTEQKATEL